MAIRDGFIGAIGNTPLIRLKGASERTGCEILGKAEFLNPGGSVKDRAALAIVRDAEVLRSAMSLQADYLPDHEGREPFDFTPESSRRARGLEIWAAIRSLGRDGVEALVERNCLYAKRFAEGLHEAGYEILNDVALNQVLVAFGDDRTTSEVIQGLQRDGTCWCGITRWRGRTAMRISVSSWATTASDVERSLAAILRVARGVGHRGG